MVVEEESEVDAERDAWDVDGRVLALWRRGRCDVDAEVERDGRAREEGAAEGCELSAGARGTLYSVRNAAVPVAILRRGAAAELEVDAVGAAAEVAAERVGRGA